MQWCVFVQPFGGFMPVMTQVRVSCLSFDKSSNTSLHLLEIPVTSLGWVVSKDLHPENMAYVVLLDSWLSSEQAIPFSLVFRMSSLFDAVS